MITITDANAEDELKAVDDEDGNPPDEEEIVMSHLELQSSDGDEEIEESKIDHADQELSLPKNGDLKIESSDSEQKDNVGKITKISDKNNSTKNLESGLAQASNIEEQIQQDETAKTINSKEVEHREQTTNKERNKSDVKTDHQPPVVENLIETANQNEPKSNYGEIVNSNSEEVDKVCPGEKESEPDHPNKQSHGESSTVTGGSHYPNLGFDSSNRECLMNESDVKLEQGYNSPKEFVLDSTTVYNLTQLQQLQSNVAEMMSGNFGHAGSAVQYHLRALENQRTIFGSQHTQVAADTESKIAGILEREQKMELCLLYCEKSLDSLKCSEEEGESRSRKMAQVAFKIAELQLNNFGNHSVALAYYLESLRAMDRLRCVSDSQLIDIHQKIGNLYLREKEFPKALSHLELADEKSQLLKSKNRPLSGDDFIVDQIDNCIKMGRIYFKTTDYTKAEDKLSRALILMDSVKRIDIELKRETLDLLGSCYFHLGEHSKALNCFESLLSSLQPPPVNNKNSKSAPSITTTPSSPEISLTLCKIGRCYLSTNQFDKALAHFKKDLEIQKQIHGDSSEEVGRACANMGEIYFKKRDTSKTLELWKKAYWILDEKLGEKNAETVLVKSYLEKLIWITV